MQKIILVIMSLLLSFTASAGLQAIGINIHSPAIFEGFCFENNLWQKCGDTNKVRPAEYRYAFHSNSLKESVVFGFYKKDRRHHFVMACKQDSEQSWRDCTPDTSTLPLGEYSPYIRPAHDGKGSYILIGEGIKEGNQRNSPLIAACRNDKNEWRNCSPPGMETIKYAQGASISYVNNQWIILDGSGTLEEDPAINYALCMEVGSSEWGNCDIRSNAPREKRMSIDKVKYVPFEKLWIAVGSRYDYELNNDVFKSICRKDGEMLWNDCTGDMVIPDEGRSPYHQSGHGELFRLDSFENLDDERGLLSIGTNVLCMSANSPWKDCTGNLNYKTNQSYPSATMGKEGELILIGNHPNENLSRNTAYLMATWNGKDWEIISQLVENDRSALVDIFYVE